jgi:hypothetical protein
MARRPHGLAHDDKGECVESEVMKERVDTGRVLDDGIDRRLTVREAVAAIVEGHDVRVERDGEPVQRPVRRENAGTVAVEEKNDPLGPAPLQMPSAQRHPRRGDEFHVRLMTPSGIGGNTAERVGKKFRWPRVTVQPPDAPRRTNAPADPWGSHSQDICLQQRSVDIHRLG